jgi:hypothetical protein
MTKKLIYSKRLGWHEPIKHPCMNCGELIEEGQSGHFAPPSFMEPGFFICKFDDSNRAPDE